MLPNLPELLSEEEISMRYALLNDEWSLVDFHHLRGEFKFPNFAEAMEFTVKVGRVAEQMNHHPEINLEWGLVDIIIFTHDRGGLTDWDFEFAENVSRI